jgi:hemin uptake protein HemP
VDDFQTLRETDQQLPTQFDETHVVRSEELFAGQRVLLIEHAGQRYRLLITRNERLILQK